MELFPQRANLIFGGTGQMSNLPVGEAERFGAGEFFSVK
jgi:hypothetical protein